MVRALAVGLPRQVWARVVVELQQAWEQEVLLVTEQRQERAQVAAAQGGWRASKGRRLDHRAAEACPW